VRTPAAGSVGFIPTKTSRCSAHQNSAACASSSPTLTHVRDFFNARDLHRPASRDAACRLCFTVGSTRACSAAMREASLAIAAATHPDVGTWVTRSRPRGCTSWSLPTQSPITKHIRHDRLMSCFFPRMRSSVPLLHVLSLRLRSRCSSPRSLDRAPSGSHAASPRDEEWRHPGQGR
jgi:hypothetical protein